MINTSTKPEKILVIDDNYSWLETLKTKGIQVFYCKSISISTIENKVAEKEGFLEVIVVNAHLLIGLGSQRSDLQGLELGFKILAPQFPSIRFIPLSFCFKDIENQTACCYTQFLTTLLEITNE